ncbi:MAG: class I tRNA ligase family protein, partial [Candidatus Aenigmarchaeota archaeon]|nr:class I tRNA ligase family protein [Candidatus Aenigmarchaeota archaeon]
LIINDFSRWYMKIAKQNIEGTSLSAGASYTLLNVLDTTIKMLAPICPFMTEKIYLELFKKTGKVDSVHMLSYPVPNIAIIDAKLETSMHIVDQVVEAVSALRQDAGIRLRWPVRSVKLAGGKDIKTAVKDLGYLMESLCNSKEVIFGDMDLDIEVKPNFAVLGPKFGKDAGKVVKAISTQDPEKLKDKIAKGPVTIDGFRIDSTMLKIEEKIPEGLSGQSFDGGSVYLDTERTESLEDESLAREVIRQIQVMRKEKGLDISEKAEVWLSGEDKTMNTYKKVISKETNSNVVIGKPEGKKKESVDFKGRKVEVSL